jgi:uncharacterized protein YjbI with pentapeptide repeats
MAAHGVSRQGKRLKEPVGPKIPERLTLAQVPGDEPTDDGLYLSLEYGPEIITGFDAEDVEFERCRFQGTCLSTGTMRRVSITDVAFEGCDLANLRMPDSRVFNTTVANCRMTGMHLTSCGFRDVLFDSCRADLTSFRFSRLTNVVFRDCNLSESNFQSADLRGVRFEGCKLTAAQFSNADMKGARLVDCNLDGVGGIQSLAGAIVPSADAHTLVYALSSALGIVIED